MSAGLLHGDVGSGKTAVALVAMLAAASAGYQAVLIAPTEILAQQHAATMEALLTKLREGAAARGEDAATAVPAMAVYSAATTKGKGRKVLDAQLASGEVQLVVGTHSIFNVVDWHKLGFVVIDEQHKFGMEQKESLSKVMDGRAPPHVLSMSATPIPRTMALISYGDMSHSDLREGPPNRRAVLTQVLTDDDASRQYLMQEVRKEIDSGGRAFIVYPLRGACSLKDMRSADGEFKTLQASTALGKDRCVLVHGKLKSEEKAAALAQFRDGSRPVCVCTTVVEVGVDVQEASIMIVEHADRFGLASLHQLRGRVGRGARPSRCFLMAPVEDEEDEDEEAPAPRKRKAATKGLPSPASTAAAAVGAVLHDPFESTAMRRLRVLETTSDGFAIAEADLEMRGAGAMFGGNSQAGKMGITAMCMRELIKDRTLLSTAQAAAKAALEAGPTPLLRSATATYARAAKADVPPEAESDEDGAQALGLYM